MFQAVQIPFPLCFRHLRGTINSCFPLATTSHPKPVVLPFPLLMVTISNLNPSLEPAKEDTTKKNDESSKRRYRQSVSPLLVTLSWKELNITEPPPNASPGPDQQMIPSSEEKEIPYWAVVSAVGRIADSCTPKQKVHSQPKLDFFLPLHH